MAAPPPPIIIANAHARNAVDGYAPIIMNPMDPQPVLLRAARCAHNRAALARDLVGPPGLVMTEDEFGATAVVYSQDETSTVAAAAGAAVLPDGVLGAGPAWAATFINTVNNINNTVNNINNTVNNINNTLANHTATLANLTARQMNSTTSMDNRTDQQLAALTDAAGNIPAYFPATVGALHNLDGPTLHALLTHYGLNDVPNLSVEARRRRFQQFIGIIRP
jgi:hypothetical protein